MYVKGGSFGQIFFYRLKYPISLYHYQPYDDSRISTIFNLRFQAQKQRAHVRQRPVEGRTKVEGIKEGFPL